MKNVGECGGQTTCYAGGSTVEKPDDSTSGISYEMVIMLIILVFVIIIAVSLAYPAYQLYKKNI
jgi:cell division protein FtsL